jgi:hypothetical protein
MLFIENYYIEIRRGSQPGIMAGLEIKLVNLILCMFTL